VVSWCYLNFSTAEKVTANFVPIGLLGSIGKIYLGTNLMLLLTINKHWSLDEYLFNKTIGCLTIRGAMPKVFGL